MILSVNCKINLGLHILERRADGYHNIETVLYPVPELSDSLEMLPASCDSFTTSGIEIDAPPEQNICLKALALMRLHYSVPPVAIHLHKMIPFGAGLGGGSADASFLMCGLNELFCLGASLLQLEQLAAQIGSDTPFFVRNTPALCSGRGEIMTPWPVDLSQYRIEIVKPSVGVSTAQAYRGVKPFSSRPPLAELLARPIEQWSDCVVNDFEASVMALHPEIAAIKQELYRRGAIYASMSGSGSALFGIFAR